MYGNTYEIFMQPNFRDNFDAWRETPLEQMDNRNLSAKERANIEEQKRASIAMRSKKDEKVVRDAGEGDELNEQGMNQKEVKIIREERKKRIMNHMLCQTFHLIDEKSPTKPTALLCWGILDHSWFLGYLHHIFVC